MVRQAIVAGIKKIAKILQMAGARAVSMNRERR